MSSLVSGHELCGLPPFAPTRCLTERIQILRHLATFHLDPRPSFPRVTED